MELILLSAAPLPQTLPLLKLSLSLSRRLRVLLRQGNGVTPGQLLHRLAKAEALPVLQPADWIGALVAHEAVHPVGAGADGASGVAVLVPGAEGEELGAAAL